MNQKVVTSRLFGDYLDCPMKCFLRAAGEPVTENFVTAAMERRSASHNEKRLCGDSEGYKWYWIA